MRVVRMQLYGMCLRVVKGAREGLDCVHDAMRFPGPLVRNKLALDRPRSLRHMTHKHTNT